MPLYEYKCDTCGSVFEVIQKFSDAPLAVHENCGGAVHRLLSAPALQFKGTGFYITDYAKGNGGASHKKSGSGESKGESSSSESKDSKSTESKSESKPAASTPSSTSSTSTSSDKK